MERDALHSETIRIRRPFSPPGITENGRRYFYEIQLGNKEKNHINSTIAPPFQEECELLYVRNLTTDFNRKTV